MPPMMQGLVDAYFKNVWTNRGFQFGIGCTVALLTVSLKRRVFLAHVLYVTSVLAGELSKFATLYGKMRPPKDDIRKLIIGGAYFHTITPFLMYFYPKLMYVHLPFCFVVHILHMGYVYVLFSDMGYHDPAHLGFLVSLNATEFCTNAAFMVSDELYVLIAVATEFCCPFLLSFKMKKKGQRTSGAPASSKSPSVPIVKRMIHISGRKKEKHFQSNYVKVQPASSASSHSETPNNTITQPTSSHSFES